MKTQRGKFRHPHPHMTGPGTFFILVAQHNSRLMGKPVFQRLHPEISAATFLPLVALKLCCCYLCDSQLKASSPYGLMPGTKTILRSCSVAGFFLFF